MSGARLQTDASTRERLIDAAEHLFAVHGYRDTSVRQITNAASANAAAVNYHFGGKDNLYRDVMRHNLEMFFDGQLAAIRSVMSKESHEPTVEELIRAFTRAWLSPVTSGNAHVVQLSLQERADRRLPDDLARKCAQSVEDAFAKAICQLAGMTDVAARQCVRCVEVLLNGLLSEAVSQVRSRTGHVAGAGLKELIEQVIRFSVAGVNGFSRR